MQITQIAYAIEPKFKKQNCSDLPLYVTYIARIFSEAQLVVVAKRAVGVHSVVDIRTGPSLAEDNVVSQDVSGLCKKKGKLDVEKKTLSSMS